MNTRLEQEFVKWFAAFIATLIVTASTVFTCFLLIDYFFPKFLGSLSRETVSLFFLGLITFCFTMPFVLKKQKFFLKTFWENKQKKM
jgi:hypothetical protein